VKTKLCRRCGLIKNIDLFNREPRSKDGLHSYCKECSGKIRDNCKENNRKRNRLGIDFIEKACSRCQKVRPVSWFYKSLASKDGLSEMCKECRLDATHNLRKRYKENNKYANLNKERELYCNRCKQKKSSFLFYKYSGNKTGFQDICKACTRDSQRRNKYGITPDSLIELIRKQENKCAICGNVFTKEFHIDHSHATNIVRGLLCEKCNLALGLFKDNPAILRSAISYLEQSSAKENSHVV